MADVLQRMDKDGCAKLESGGKVCRYDYDVDGKHIEAISFVPAGGGPFPGVLMIPGYERTARDLAGLGMRLAREGFSGVAVTQPGFGKSDGPADFVGPKTLAVLTMGYRRLQKEPYVDPKRMAIYGYSRGGMAASLLAEQIDDVKAAVLGAGVYDFKRLYDESTLPGVRQNMKAETGMTKEAIAERSSVLRMDQLKCPVLILHGEKDKNVPVSQAKLLRDRLTQLHKEFEIKLFPDREHSIGPEVGDMTVDFFRRKLQEPASSQKN
ncbi:MAG TPA: prolyl oligopeptidase family serine peptidase [Candidatus Angelobacter sp.]|nr:prolyl oligopeptidase family serine peptidase [Candidatus Angelobacter sp.]